MLRYLTAGESHGQALIATMEGIPAHVRVGVPEIAENLRRRRLGVGRGVIRIALFGALVMLDGQPQLRRKSHQRVLIVVTEVQVGDAFDIKHADQSVKSGDRHGQLTARIG